MSDRILVIGDIITDVVAIHSGPLAADSDTPARITTMGGGAGANVATWLAHAGATVDLLGVVGVDFPGEERVEELTAAGVGCASVVWSRTARTATIIVLSDGRHRTMITDRGANHELQASHVDEAFAALPDLRHVHVSGYTLLDESTRPAGLRALQLAPGLGASTSVDAASVEPLRRVGPDRFFEWIDDVGILFANLDEARVLSSRVDDDPATVALVLAEPGFEVVVKLGSDGAVWAVDDHVRTARAPAVTVVDTTGAGDAFTAGYLAARFGAGPDAALAAAVRLGAQAVTLVGARPPGVEVGEGRVPS